MKLLVHVTCGPEQPSRAALAFLIAKTAVEEGHDVTVFLGADAVHLLRDAVLDALVGVGTGSLREWYEAIAAGGGQFRVSRMSSQARGLGESDLEGKPAEFVAPKDVVALIADSDRVVSY